jgi:hypothetical protein
MTQNPIKEKTTLKTFKALLASAALATSLVAIVAPSPASASTGDSLAFSVNATVACFGCGATSATGSGTVSGQFHGQTFVNAVLTINAPSPTVNEPALTCPATGTVASGNFAIAGGPSGTFDWGRVGAAATVTVRPNGHPSGTGAATLVVTAPLGNPCGQANVKVTVTGAVSFTS